MKNYVNSDVNDDTLERKTYYYLERGKSEKSYGNGNLNLLIIAPLAQELEYCQATHDFSERQTDRAIAHDDTEESMYDAIQLQFARHYPKNTTKTLLNINTA